MMKIGCPLQYMTRIVIKRQKLLSATYHTAVSYYAKNKEVAKTETKEIEILDKKTDSQLGKYEISDDIMKPPPIDEELPNPRDITNRMDMREIPKQFHVSTISKNFTMKAEMIFQSLASQPKNIQTFKKATELYLEKEGVYHRGMVEFNLVALNKLAEYNVLWDLNAYKALMNVFPKERLKPQGFWQAELMHYPKQQDCAITIIDTMEMNGVMPDVEFGKILYAVFGSKTYASRKLQRTMYWMPKFRHANPYPIPKILPEDKIELAKRALKRMAFDINNEITVWKTNQIEDDSVEEDTSITTQMNEDNPEIKDSYDNDEMIKNHEKDTLVTNPMRERNQTDDTFIVSAQSPEQRELIQKLSTKKAVFVDGGYNVWLRNKLQTYFVLRGESDSEVQETDNEDDDEDLFNWTPYFGEERLDWLKPKKPVHEQDDGVILAMCITGTSSRDSLMSWIRFLQKSNPNLEQIPVIFTLRTEGQETALVKQSANDPSS